MIISHHIRKFETLCCSYADAESGRIMEVRQQNGGSTTTSYTTLFLVKDHLGSVRAVTDSQGHILERNSYYPFGLQTNQGESYPTISGTLTALYPNILSATSIKRDLYNGKEIQTVAGTDYLDYGFRQYDPVTARWMAIDPKAEKYQPLTPFNYALNNPIVIVDRKGKDPITGIIDAVVAFAVSAGTDIAESMIFEDKSFKEATESINWKAATINAGISYLESLLITGTGSLITFAKIGKSRAGRFVIRTALNTINSALENYFKGEYDDDEGNFSYEKFQDNLGRLFVNGAIGSLIDMGYEKKANKLERNLSRNYEQIQKEEEKIAEKSIKKTDQTVLKKRYKKRDKAQRDYTKSYGKQMLLNWDKEALKKTFGEIDSK